MKKRLSRHLKIVWFVLTALALILPVFLPSTPGGAWGNLIGNITALMFILSFPLSLCAMPLLFFLKLLLEVEPQSIGGMYLNVFILCVMGYVQWFWLVPKLLRGGADENKVLSLLDNPLTAKLPEAERRPAANQFWDGDGRTFVEKVIDDRADNKH